MNQVGLIGGELPNLGDGIGFIFEKICYWLRNQRLSSLWAETGELVMAGNIKEDGPVPLCKLLNFVRSR